jgi:hypothetical protein
VQSTLTAETFQNFPTVVPEGVSVNAGRWYFEVTIEVSTSTIQLGYVIKGKYTGEM